jgi:hypothetical protein
MQEYMIRDSHGISQIQSLYFDTPDYLLARRSMEHPLYKEKIRLRSYGQADDHTKVFLELKKKFEGVVYKRRVSMDMTKAEELMENWSSNRYGVTEVDCNPQILRELEASVARYPKLIPRILLTYRREAFYQRDDHDFRVTLDQEIGWRNEDLSLRDPMMGRPLLGILPAIVCVVIMMVNGNIGTGVAVAGVFSLVRFRSVPGTAREIAAIFLGMGAGLICGMGYIGFAAAFAVVLGIIIFAFNLKMADDKATNRTLRITVPEDLDFAGQFDEILSRYTAENKLVTMKTTNMGSLYKLTYDITMMDPSQERAMVDELRTRNGNLEIAITERQDHTVVL